jgi:hypothetical protein
MFEPPQIINSSRGETIKTLINKHPEVKIVDDYLHQIDELFTVTHPNLAHDNDKKIAYIKKNFGDSPHKTGNWIYFPWNNTFVHLLEKNLFYEARTARNKPLITRHQQHRFGDLVVGIVGLSVGSSIALTLAQSGGANTMKLADFDYLSITNLNRIKASTLHLGQNKTRIIAQQIYEINPYANLILFEQGIRPDNLIDFVQGSHPLNLIIDEADDMATKQFLRKASQAAHIPLLMTTDNASKTSMLVCFNES